MRCAWPPSTLDSHRLAPAKTNVAEGSTRGNSLNAVSFSILDTLLKFAFSSAWSLQCRRLPAQQILDPYARTRITPTRANHRKIRSCIKEHFLSPLNIGNVNSLRDSPRDARAKPTLIGWGPNTRPTRHPRFSISGAKSSAVVFCCRVDHTLRRQIGARCNIVASLITTSAPTVHTQPDRRTARHTWPSFVDDPS